MKIHRPKQTNIFQIILVVFFLFGASACQSSRSLDSMSSTNVSDQQTQLDTAAESTMAPLPPVDIKLTESQPTQTNAKTQITVDLDGSQITEPLSGIAVRILFDTSTSNSDPQLPKEPFTIPAALTDMGWTVAINRQTQETGVVAAELALINTNSQGLLMSESTLLGTINLPSAQSEYQPYFDRSTTQIVTKSAQEIPLNFSEQNSTEP